MNCKLCESGFDFTMIGGNSEKIIFEAVNEYMNDADIVGCSASFSICRYDERHSDNAIRINDVVLSGNTVTVSFAPEDTIDLSGKYVGQLSIFRPAEDSTDHARLANMQGNVIIIRNIDNVFNVTKSEVE